MYFQDRLRVSNIEELKNEIMTGAHHSPYTIHPSNTKKHQNLCNHYWWNNMKRKVVGFTARCLVCQQVKAERKQPPGLLKQLDVPDWKWEHIMMDFISGLPSIHNTNNIWVIVDKLTKVAHFLPMNMQTPRDELAIMHMEKVVTIHGVSLSIVSDRDSRFLGKFWTELQEALGTMLNFSTAYYP